MTNLIIVYIKIDNNFSQWPKAVDFYYKMIDEVNICGIL